MRRIDILLTSDIDGGLAPFRHGELEAVFHRWTDLGDLPLLEGALWAFIDWVMPDISGLEVCRRLRCDPLTAQAHVTMILDEDDPEARRRALRTRWLSAPSHAAGFEEAEVPVVGEDQVIDHVDPHDVAGAHHPRGEDQIIGAWRRIA